jgi:hypothetical protein
MSYCRFENTANDLDDCVNAINNGATRDLNRWEVGGLARILELCEQVMDEKSCIERIIEEQRNAQQ